MYERACPTVRDDDAGSWRGACEALADTLDKAPGGPADPRLERACPFVSAGYGKSLRSACEALAEMLDEGLGGPADPRLADEIRGKRKQEGDQSIRKIIREHIGEVRECYQKALDHSSRSFEGRVAVRFTIAPSGRVQNAFVHQTSLRNPGVENCVLKALKKWRFDKREGIAVVTYPFVFQTPKKTP
jgi:TonB family protein